MAEVTRQPVEVGLVRDPDVLHAYRSDVSGLVGNPEAVFRPRDEKDLRDLVDWAARTRTALLPVGARTSTTGASVALRGVVVDLASMAFQPELDLDRRSVRAAAATNLGELRSEVRSRGLYLAADPTSAPDCTVGGAVATNASGPATYRYGSIVSHVRALRILDGRGRRHLLHTPEVEKSAMGPVAFQDPVRWFVGSEGLLGFVTEVEFALREAPALEWGVFVGFPTRKDLLGAVALLRAERRSLPLRAVEWLDRACCELVRPYAGRLSLPDARGGGLYVEIEGSDPRAMERVLERVAELLGKAGGQVDRAQVLQDAGALRYFGELRHRVPDSLNRLGAELRDRAGGGKLSTDWSAPMDQMEELLAWTDSAVSGIDLEGFFAYGHIGNGHPHLNLICADAVQKMRASELIERQLGRVVAAGGVPTSEHGIGKLKRAMVAPYLPPGFVEGLRALKAHFDPAGILAEGNILPPRPRGRRE